MCTKMHSFAFGHANLDLVRYFDNTSRNLEFSRVSMHLVWYMHGFDHFELFLALFRHSDMSVT